MLDGVAFAGYVREQMEQVLSRHTGREVATLRADTDRDKIFTAEQAVAYGLADHIISTRVPAGLSGG